MTAIFQDVGIDDDTRERFETILPDHALEKILRLQQIAEERSDTISRVVEKQRKEADKRRQWQAENALYAEDRGEFPSAEMAERIAKNKRRIDESYKRTEELQRQQKLKPTLVLDLLFEELIGLPRDVVLNDGRVSVKIAKSEDPLERVGASRNVIAKLTSERGRVRRSLLPKDVALHRAITDIRRAAAEGAPDFSPNARLVSPSITSRPRQGTTDWPMLSLETGHHVIEMIDAVALMKYALQDQLIAAATVSISKLYEGNPLVVPESERQARMDQIDAQILAEARVEEALIEVAEARGLEILRRPDAPPLAVLGVAIAPAAPVEQKPKAEAEFG